MNDLKVKHNVNLELLMDMVDQKYVSVQQHPDCDMFIFNYTPRAAYERMWNEATMAARGLILDSRGEIWARPFPKFFNLSEWSDNPLRDLPKDDPFSVTEKMDGSLGIMYFNNDTFTPEIATRGSFRSDQAIHATQVLWDKYRDWAESITTLSEAWELTFLFEIIYPQNRIVVDYHNMDDLVLLGVRGHDDGHEYVIFDGEWPGPKVKRYDGFTDVAEIAKLAERQEDNKEGFVVHFYNSDLRLKVKFEEYCRLHKIVTGVSTKTIWEYMKDNRSLDELLDRVPDEFFDWVKGIVAEIQAKYTAIDTEARKTFLELEAALGPAQPASGGYRKRWAEMIKNLPNKAILFKLLDGKDYRNMIYAIIRPEYAKPFTEDPDNG